MRKDLKEMTVFLSIQVYQMTDRHRRQLMRVILAC